GHLRPVLLEPARIVGLWRGLGGRIAADDVDPAEDAPAKVRLRAVDTRVEQRDRHPAPDDARKGNRPGGGSRAGEQPRRLRGRIRHPYRVDARDLRRALEYSQPAGVDRSGEAVQDARE